jgi:SET domain
VHDLTIKFCRHQFFGLGLNDIRRLLETSSGVEAVVTQLSVSSPKYKFCFACSSDPASFVDLIIDLERKRAATRAEKALQNRSGCARTEGVKAVARSGGSGRITRALVRSAEEEVISNAGTNSGKAKKGEEKAKVDKNLTQVKYHQMKSIPIDQRLVARRSHIHGWGLFTKSDIDKDNPVVEYMGEIVRQPIADKREKEYELSGEGSCYMFRLDLHRIVDATKIGSMARFMNHSCQPNAYAKIINVDTDVGPEKKIVVFALRDISAGEEITYGTFSITILTVSCRENVTDTNFRLSLFCAFDDRLQVSC